MLNVKDTEARDTAQLVERLLAFTDTPVLFPASHQLVMVGCTGSASAIQQAGGYTASTRPASFLKGGKKRKVSPRESLFVSFCLYM